MIGNHYPRPAQTKALELCHSIESAGASEQLTRCTILASELAALVRDMEETLHDIHDFDDGAWAAGKHHKEAVALGRVTIRSLATDCNIRIRAARTAQERKETT